MTDIPAIWHDLRRFTPARVGLGRVGNGMPTGAHLAFQAAHAAARDAVHARLDVAALQAALPWESIVVSTVCSNRRDYLLRPDLGRALAPGQALPVTGGIVFLLCDGLSAVAVQRHSAPLVAELAPIGLANAPIVIAEQGRVALGDPVGFAMGAEAVVVLIGERPGLSTPDSLGAYLTWQPRPGRTDAERNCVSNIRPEGLAIPAAARKLMWLITEMRRRRLTGVELKDEQALEGPQVKSISVVST